MEAEKKDTKGIVSAVTGGIGNIVSTAGKAVEGTTQLAKKATDIAVKLGDKSLDAAGVIGSATLDAAGALGSTSIAAVSTLGTSSLKAVGDIGSKGIESTASITSGVLGATDKIANAALDAAAITTTAATQTVATGATVTADVTKQTITKTGEVLKAGVGAATKITETGLNGIRRVAELAGQRGELTAKKIEASTTAKSKAFESIGKNRMDREQAKIEFKRSSSDVMNGVKELVSIQKTSLAANIHMYRKAKCGWLSRTFGTCPVKVSEDVNNAKRIAAVFLSSLDRTAANALMQLNIGKDADVVVEEYLQKTNTLSEKFQADFSKLINKYATLADEALTTTGGRRKKTYRKKKQSSRVSRASRKRPSVRGRSF